MDYPDFLKYMKQKFKKRRRKRKNKFQSCSSPVVNILRKQDHTNSLFNIPYGYGDEYFPRNEDATDFKAFGNDNNNSDHKEEENARKIEYLAPDVTNPTL